MNPKEQAEADAERFNMARQLAIDGANQLGQIHYVIDLNDEQTGVYSTEEMKINGIRTNDPRIRFKYGENTNRQHEKRR